MGKTLKDLKKLDNSISSFEKALKLKMDSNSCLAEIGEVLIRKGNYTEGLSKLKAGEGSIKFDLKQSFDSKPVAKCIEKDCDEECQRQFSVVPVVFKGSGWYVNDYAKKSDSSTSKPAPSQKPSEKKDTKKESKPSNKTSE